MGLELGEPWILLEGPQSQLGGPWIQLGGPWSQLGGPWSQLGGQEPAGRARGTEKKPKKKQSVPGTGWYHKKWGNLFSQSLIEVST